MPGAVLGLTCRTRQTRAWGQVQVAPLRGPGSAEGTTMQELRLVAVSEDGSYAVLAVPGRSGRFSLPIDDRLRTVARGQFSRLAQYDIEVESPLRPKEIQDRIRAGETADEIADAAGIPIERVRRFEGPVLAEREYRAQEAQQATVRGPGDVGPRAAARRDRQRAARPDRDEPRRRAVGLAQAAGRQLASAADVHHREPAADGRVGVRPAARHASPADDNAARLCLSGSDLPAGPAGHARARDRDGHPDRVTVRRPPGRVAPGREPARSPGGARGGWSRHRTAGPAPAAAPSGPAARSRSPLRRGKPPGGPAAGRARCGPGPGSAPGPEGRGRPVPPGVGAVLGRDHAGHVPPAGLSAAEYAHRARAGPLGG